MTWGPALHDVSRTGSVLAHGLGGRTDLPPDPRLAAIGAAIAVGGSFLIMGALWPSHRLGGQVRGRPLPGVTRVVDARIVVLSLRMLVLAAAILVVAVAFLGPRESRFNLAPYAVYVGFWVGLAITAVLVGPVWPRVNPLRTVHAGICRLSGLKPGEGLIPLTPKVGLWPAAGWLLVFVWLELVYPQRAEPEVVGLFLASYGVLTILLALLFGSAWFAAGDGFEVYNRLFGSLAALGRRDDGMLVLRNPLNGLASLPHSPGLTGVVVVLIGSTGFDGLTRTSWWQRSIPPDSVVLGTFGLLALVAAVGALYTCAMYLGARSAGLPRGREATGNGTAAPGVEPAYAVPGAGRHAQAPITSPPPRKGKSGTKLLSRTPPTQSAMPGLFAHSLIPIALGYTVAHYFSFFLFEGQVLLALVSDPFGLGWNLFGTIDRGVNYLLIGTGTIARIQVYAIVIGHVCGVVAAHDRALVLLPPKVARRGQYPLGVVMTGITLGGVLLLLSA